MFKPVRSGGSAGGAGLVGFIEQVDDLGLGVGLAEEATEGVLLKIAEDIFHGLEVAVGFVGGGKEEEDGVDGGLVEGGEVDADGGAADGADAFFEGGMFDVGNGYAFAEACGADFFAVDDGFDDGIDVGGVDGFGGGESVDEFADDAVAVVGFEFGEDGIFNDEVSKFHEHLKQTREFRRAEAGSQAGGQSTGTGSN